MAQLFWLFFFFDMLMFLLLLQSFILILQQDEIPVDESQDETDAEVEQKETNPISSILYEESKKSM